MMFNTVPNILTLLRVGLVPVLAFFMSMDMLYAHKVAFILFVVAALTDYLDGKLARSWSQTSLFGAFFDPVADKLLVLTTLLMLAHRGQLPHYNIIPGLIIVFREIFVSSLRSFLVQLDVKILVSWYGKIKTTMQFLALMLLVLHPRQTLQAPWLETSGFIMLWAAALLTVYSGYECLRAGIKHFSEKK